LLGGIERIIGGFLMLIGYGLVSPIVFMPRLGVMIYQGQAKTNRIPVITKVVVSFLSTLVVAFVLSFIEMPELF
jgi:hypothetical protein